MGIFHSVFAKLFEVRWRYSWVILANFTIYDTQDSSATSFRNQLKEWDWIKDFINISQVQNRISSL